MIVLIVAALVLARQPRAPRNGRQVNSSAANAGATTADAGTSTANSASGLSGNGLSGNGPSGKSPSSSLAGNGLSASGRSGAGAPGVPVTPRAVTGVQPAPARHLKVKVLSVRPHDATAYTQGLIWDHGKLYESAGLYAHSSLRQVDPKTGAVLRRIEVAPGFFAEGLAQVGEKLVQLTWREGVAFVYDMHTFQRVGEFRYEGEGWGLCNDGRRLVMSDGSDHLSFRDPATFALRGGVDVRLDGRPAFQLNELECVGDSIYANVYQTDEILRIDPRDGRVTEVIDASGLLDPAERERTDVLNGIAWDPVNKDFLITGKLWPKLFEVTFVPAN